MVDIDILAKAFFYTDKPVPYKLSEDNVVYINPVGLVDSETFVASCSILQIDKNALPSVEIIQMPYLDFLMRLVIPSDETKVQLDKFFNIMRLCTGWENWLPIVEENHIILKNNETGATINHKQFDDIKRIILYQNLLGYDDSYVNPDIKKAIDETNELKMAAYKSVSLERKIAIVTAHCGLPKREQLEMTMRAHQLLFNECVDEVEFTTTRPIAVYAGKTNEMEHWIYKRKKDKYSDYVMSVEEYSKSIGGDSQVLKNTNSTRGDELDAMYNKANSK